MTKFLGSVLSILYITINVCWDKAQPILTNNFYQFAVWKMIDYKQGLKKDPDFWNSVHYNGKESFFCRWSACHSFKYGHKHGFRNMSFIYNYKILIGSWNFNFSLLLSQYVNILEDFLGLEMTENNPYHQSCPDPY